MSPGYLRNCVFALQVGIKSLMTGTSGSGWSMRQPAGSQIQMRERSGDFGLMVSCLTALRTRSMGRMSEAWHGLALVAAGRTAIVSLSLYLNKCCIAEGRLLPSGSFCSTRHIKHFRLRLSVKNGTEAGIYPGVPPKPHPAMPSRPIRVFRDTSATLRPMCQRECWRRLSRSVRETRP